MDDDPYRSGKRPKSELERLAAEGDLRRAALQSRASSEANQESDFNLRVALGGAFGTPFLRSVARVHHAVLAVVAIGVVLVVFGHDEAWLSPIAGTAVFTAFILIFVRVFWTPKAPPSMVDAESRWLSSLPFPMEGYFEALSATPSVYCSLEFAVTFSGAAPDAALFRGVVQRLDPEAQCSTHRWTSTKIDGSTNIRSNVSVRRTKPDGLLQRAAES